MKLPAKGTLRSQILEYIYQVGPTSYEALVIRFPESKPAGIAATLGRMVSFCELVSNKGSYSVHSDARRMLAGESLQMPAPVETRYIPPMKPWSGKYSLPTQAPRHDAQPLRDISFISASPAASDFWSNK